MIKKIILSLVLIVTFKSNSQDINKKEDNKFLVSLHYTGNLRNNNFIGDSYNGVLGLDARYTIVEKDFLSIQAGLGIDYLKSRENSSQLKMKDALIVNPNVGIEFAVSKEFKPFFNLGYSFFSAKYTISSAAFLVASQYDPLIQGGNVKGSFNYNSISINPGFRFFIDQKLYIQTDYKYLPIDSNLNVHLIAIGLGLNF